jgi:hypothetical protein
MKRHLPYSLKSDPCAGRNWIEPKLLLAMLVVMAAALNTGQPTYAAGFAADVGGRWYHDGKPTNISVSGMNVTITNEHGQSSSGHSTGNDLVMPFLGIRGVVSDGGRRISWSNGTTWTRREHGSDFGQGFGRGLDGRWYHDGKPTSISVSSGGSVTITNEQGQSSRGSMSGNEIVISGGLRGHVGQGGRRISWSNGTEWRR